MTLELIEIIGWLGTFFLSTCAIPQLVKSIKTKRFEGLSPLFVTWWLLGEIFTLTYIFHEAFKWPLIFNYIFNTTACTIILGLYLGVRIKEKHYLNKLK